MKTLARFNGVKVLRELTGFAVFALMSFTAFSQPDNVPPVDQLIFDPVPLSEAPSNPGPFPAGAQGSNSGGDASIRLERINRIKDYLESSDEYEAEEGPYSSELRENLHTLGKLYQQQGDHDEAISHLERALNIMRVNNGLKTLDQVPLLKDLAESYKVRERFSKADETRERIVELYQANHGPDAVEVVPAMAELGEWNIQAFLARSSVVKNVPRVDASGIINPNHYTPEVKTVRDTPLFKLAQAQSNYSEALKLLVDKKAFDNPHLLDLEHQLRTTYLLSFHRYSILYEPDFYLTRKRSKTGSLLDQNPIEKRNSEEYKKGQKSLERSFSYIVHSEKTTVRDLATTMLEEADWDLLFARKVKAANRYQEVYDYFNNNPDLDKLASKFLHPEIPVVLPTYLPPPNSREKMGIPDDAEIDYFGYFDVSFVINKFGKARNVRILGKGGQLTDNMEFRLKQYLNKVLFRPRFTEDGEPDTREVSYRYYVGG